MCKREGVEKSRKRGERGRKVEKEAKQQDRSDGTSLLGLNPSYESYAHIFGPGFPSGFKFIGFV